MTACGSRTRGNAIEPDGARPASWLTYWAPHLPAEAEARFRVKNPVADFLEATLDRLEVAEVDGRIIGAVLILGDCLEDLHVSKSFQRERLRKETPEASYGERRHAP